MNLNSVTDLSSYLLLCVIGRKEFAGVAISIQFGAMQFTLFSLNHFILTCMVFLTSILNALLQQ